METQDCEPANSTVGQLVRETGITAAEARRLVLLLGPNWSSLVREAKLLCKASYESTEVVG